MKESFIFQRSFSDSIKCLPERYRLPLFEAIAEYGLNGVEPDFGCQADRFILDAVWAGVKPQLDTEHRRHLNGCEREHRVRWSKRTVDHFLRTDVHVPISAKREFIKRYIAGNEAFPTSDARLLIQKMDYQDFLKTPYWKAIALYVKEKSGKKCSICGGDKKLHIHHKSYDNHGDELHHLDDLICVCQKCHKRLHEK